MSPVHTVVASPSVRTSWWWGFVPYAVVGVVHVVVLALGATAVAVPTKLLLMPLLIVAVVWGGRGTRWTTPLTLLVIALAFSWLGDAGPYLAPDLMGGLPLMLGAFGVAHALYIALFLRLAQRRLPWWSLVYAAWWIALLLVLWPHLGPLSFAVAGYGLLLGGTAVTATRCHPAIVVGAVLFLCSDSILAFRLFLPDAMPDWTSPAVMLTYTLGQGLIAAGVLLSRRRAA
jgi:uncharacterized membrane protein YhhN